jgi:uncharacterized membrane protein
MIKCDFSGRLCSVILIAVILLSCSENKKEETVSLAVQDTAQSVKSAQSAAGKDSFPVILKPWMIARGSEPGWFAQFYDDSVAIELDHGAKKLHFKYDFSKVEDSNFTAKIQSQVTAGGKPTNEDIKIIVVVRSCTEEGSGEKRERSIQLSYKDKTYTGCATVDL